MDEKKKGEKCMSLNYKIKAPSFPASKIGIIGTQRESPSIPKSGVSMG